jgi:hypothetical protein
MVPPATSLHNDWGKARVCHLDRSASRHDDAAIGFDEGATWDWMTIPSPG